jgi:lysophospholipase L1-like esterase
LVLAGGGFLFGQLIADPVWLWGATVIYGAYLLVILTLAWWRIFTPPPNPLPLRERGNLALWFGLALLWIVAAYTPSGWIFANRVLLTVCVLWLTTGGTTHRSSPTIASPVGAQRAAPALSSLSPLGERVGDRGLPLQITLISLTLTLAFTYGLDRGVALFTDSAPGGIIFPRLSRLSYRTIEFSHTVQINTHGFRGGDVAPYVDLNAPTDCRIVLLGDSFTYGWGVDYAQTWGALLEASLQADGYRAQVLNLGVPGGNVPDYAAIARTAAPYIQPNVVLVGVLQGDDFRQQSRAASRFPLPLHLGETVPQNPVGDTIAFHYPYLSAQLALGRGDVGQIWRATAANMIAGMNADQRARYLALDPAIRRAYEGGTLNPHFVHLGVVAPDYWLWPLQDAAERQPYIQTMQADFASIAATFPSAQVMVVSVPYGVYTQDESRNALTALGFNLPAELLTADADTPIQQAANAAALDFIRVTDAFRANPTLAFYPLDGHFNAEGNRLLAATLLPDVRAACG